MSSTITLSVNTNSTDANVAGETVVIEHPKCTGISKRTNRPCACAFTHTYNGRKFCAIHLVDEMLKSYTLDQIRTMLADARTKLDDNPQAHIVTVPLPTQA